MSNINSTTTVHGLVCHRDVHLALTCLGSLLKLSADPINLVMHDDGSLTPEDKEKLLSGLKGSTLLLRSEANERMNELLKNYPNCYKFRYENVLALKLLDVALLTEGNIAFCDSDILFFRPFTGLFNLPDPNTSALLMMDYLESYSVLPWHLLGSTQIKLPSKANSGLIYFRKSAHDLDFVEWFLGRDEVRFKGKLSWIEQTCWAAQSYRAGLRLWNPQQVMLMRPHTHLTSQSLAGHFVKEVRHRINEFQVKADSIEQSSEPILAQTVPSQSCNVVALTQMHVGRQLKRSQNYHKVPQMLRQKLFGIPSKDA